MAHKSKKVGGEVGGEVFNRIKVVYRPLLLLLTLHKKSKARSQPFQGSHFPSLQWRPRDNLAFSCPACNAHKYTHTHALDDLTRQIVPLFNPRIEVWSEQFAWSDDFTQIIGLTPTGRVTIETLNMNREESVNLRKALYAFGKHPPI